MSALFAVLLAAETVLVVPPSRKGEAPPAAGLAVAEAIIDVVVQTNQDRFFTLQQLAGELDRRNLLLDDPAMPAHALELARALGATEVVEGEVWLQEGRWRVEARRKRVADGQQIGVAREEGARGALPMLAYKAGLDLFPVHLAPGPLTGSAAALEQAALCELQLMGQPLRVGLDFTLPADRLAAAQRACRAALQSDSRMGLARAGWALTLAARGRFIAARKQAKRAREKRFVPLAALVEAYAAEGMGDRAGARGALAEAVDAQPGFLQARSYLAAPGMVQADPASP
ncbi:MAG TPA: hypothetical protein VMK66_01320 [Myxococcales bacterium]|nr:hypothetical protein [Myxococcales bacterium]